MGSFRGFLYKGFCDGFLRRDRIRQGVPSRPSIGDYKVSFQGFYKGFGVEPRRNKTSFWLRFSSGVSMLGFIP